jgi:hypothetical protein
MEKYSIVTACYRISTRTSDVPDGFHLARRWRSTPDRTPTPPGDRVPEVSIAANRPPIAESRTDTTGRPARRAAACIDASPVSASAPLHSAWLAIACPHTVRLATPSLRATAYPPTGKLRRLSSLPAEAHPAPSSLSRITTDDFRQPLPVDGLIPFVHPSDPRCGPRAPSSASSQHGHPHRDG